MHDLMRKDIAIDAEKPMTGLTLIATALTHVILFLFLLHFLSLSPPTFPSSSSRE